LDDGVSNANGPVDLVIDGKRTLVFADTVAGRVYAYQYDGTVGERRLFVDTGPLGGLPDGACADAEGGVCTCVVGAGDIVRHSPTGDRDIVIDTGVELPSDVTFGGADLETMFFVSIAIDIGGIHVTSPNAGRVMRVDNTGIRGRPEPRVKL